MDEFFDFSFENYLTSEGMQKASIVFLCVGILCIVVSVLVAVLIYRWNIWRKKNSLVQVTTDAQNYISTVDISNLGTNPQLRLSNSADVFTTLYEATDLTVSSSVIISGNLEANNIESGNVGNYQPYSDALFSIAQLTTSGNEVLYTTAADTYATTSITSFGKTLIGEANANSLRTEIGLGTSDTPTFDAVTISGLYPDMVVYNETQNAGTAGGSSAATTWNLRTLNTEAAVKDNSGSFALASNQFTLQPGKYYAYATAPGFQVGQMKLAIQNTGNSAYELIGPVSSTITSALGEYQVLATVEGVLNVGSATTYELRHYTEAAHTGNGLGINSPTTSPTTNNVFAQIALVKLE